MSISLVEHWNTVGPGDVHRRGSHQRQLANFTTPVAVTANTTYIASYHTNIGHYPDDINYFASPGVNNAPIHALADGVGGSKGVYVYNANPAFPSYTW
jgi:hypothetical protein